MKLSPLFALVLLLATAALADEPTLPNRPKVPGEFLLHLRSREMEPGGDKHREVHKETRWKAAQTAIIVCDMWDDHYCKLSAQRVGVMAPKMNEMLSAARDRGVMIIHAPSGTMDVYENTPYRKRMKNAPAASAPITLLNWCYRDEKREPDLPVDISTPCDDPIVGEAVRVFSRQHPAIDIIGYDGVSDSGQEIFNVCKQEGITNIAILGVHTNMCVLGRSFGIRQQVRIGMNVVLVRDMTDAMYDPRDPPYVSHVRGTEMCIEHIEKYWCPSIESGDLMKVIPGTDEAEKK
ncbi:MAG: isochorismatase family protein [Planctomycetes bacterium]|nr:isochorismatase family protein [Planctomycetia bacterium]MBI3461851.1 isochorismatase family protein [Planctomycetota bacterium]